VPPVGAGLVRRQPGDDGSKMWERNRDHRAEDADEHFENRVKAYEPGCEGGPVGQSPEDVAAHPKAKHEDGDHDGGGNNGISVDLAELADPYDLIDQAAHA